MFSISALEATRIKSLLGPICEFDSNWETARIQLTNQSGAFVKLYWQQERKYLTTKNLFTQHTQPIGPALKPRALYLSESSNLLNGQKLNCTENCKKREILYFVTVQTHVYSDEKRNSCYTYNCEKNTCENSLRSV